MDLLFKRYASPFVLVDTLIQTKSLSDFISDIYKFVSKEKEWDLFLHKVYNQSWNEFQENIKIQNTVNNVNSLETMKKSKETLMNFTPTERG